MDEEPVQNTEYETLEDGPAVQTKLESAGANLSLRVALTGVLGRRCCIWGCRPA